MALQKQGEMAMVPVPSIPADEARGCPVENFPKIHGFGTPKSSGLSLFIISLPAKKTTLRYISLILSQIHGSLKNVTFTYIYKGNLWKSQEHDEALCVERLSWMDHCRPDRYPQSIEMD